VQKAVLDLGSLGLANRRGFSNDVSFLPDDASACYFFRQVLLNRRSGNYVSSSRVERISDFGGSDFGADLERRSKSAKASDQNGDKVESTRLDLPATLRSTNCV